MGSRQRINVLKALFVGPLAAICAFGAAGDGVVDFVDVGEESGFSQPTTYGSTDKNIYILETTGTGIGIIDDDNAGDNDVIVVNGTTLDSDAARGPHLYQNNGDAQFAEVGEKAGFTDAGWWQGLCAGDYDNDGATDLMITRFGSNVLFHNSGEGSFSDSTAAAGLPTHGSRWGAGCSFLDYDKDGWLDVFVSNYVDLDLAKTPKPGDTAECEWKGIPVMCGPRGLPRATNVLYRNKGDGSFEDVSQAAGILEPGGRYGLGVVAADFDNDTWPDIYVACDMTPSLFYRNKGDGTFDDVGSQAGVAFNVDGQLQAGMGVSVADYNGNGFLDIVKSNFSGDLPSLYSNEDGVFFDDVALPAGLGVNQYLGWGALFLDADADSWPDIMLAHGHVYPEVEQSSIGESYRQPTILYRNRGNGRFDDISAQAGAGFGLPRPARGMASGDLDGDGRPEVVIVNLNQRPSLLKNEIEGGNFISMRLEGTKSNRSAIGARVTVEALGRRQLQEVRSGDSYYSHSDLALFFGLGETETAKSVTVQWPSGRKQEFSNVKANTRYALREGESLNAVR